MSSICNRVHMLFNGLDRLSFPFDESKIPKNGIYVLFEKGEKGHGADRIVRVGTHTGKDQLRSRLNQHFVNENKDRSIFRKNIGRALLNKENDPFIAQWQIDMTTKAARETHSGKIDVEKKNTVEKEVTKYLQNNMSFVVIEVNEKNERLTLESELISTISLCDECMPSANWLGLYSPVVKIRESGLWLVNELYKKALDEKRFGELNEIAAGNITSSSSAVPP